MPSTALWGSFGRALGRGPPSLNTRRSSNSGIGYTTKGCARNFMVVAVLRNLTVHSRRPSISRIWRPLRPFLLP